MALINAASSLGARGGAPFSCSKAMPKGESPSVFRSVEESVSPDFARASLAAISSALSAGRRSRIFLSRAQQRRIGPRIGRPHRQTEHRQLRIHRLHHRAQSKDQRHLRDIAGRRDDSGCIQCTRCRAVKYARRVGDVEIDLKGLTRNFRTHGPIVRIFERQHDIAGAGRLRVQHDRDNIVRQRARPDHQWTEGWASRI